MPADRTLSSTLKIRMKDELRAELELAADAEGLKPSTLARKILHDYFAARGGEKEAAAHA